MRFDPRLRASEIPGPHPPQFRPDVRRERAMLALEPDFSVVAEAEDADEAVLRFREQQPDVTLLDLRMPGGSGLRTASLHLATNDLDESPFDINLRGQAYGVGEIVPIVTLGDNTGGPRRPRGDLTLGLDGNFYGMSSYGGALQFF